MKKLYRSKTNRVFAGVCGGFGAYFNVDPVAIRVIYAICTIFSGIFPGIIAYIVAALLIPEELEHAPHESSSPETH